MSVCYAVNHIGIGGRRYRPGERLPELDDAQWQRLMELGAIRTEFPSEARNEDPDDPQRQAEKRPAPAATDTENMQSREPVNEPEDETGNEDDDDDGAELPEVDATDGIVEDEPEEAPAPRKRTRKTA